MKFVKIIYHIQFNEAILDLMKKLEIHEYVDCQRICAENENGRHFGDKIWPEMIKIFGEGIGIPEQMLNFTKKMCAESHKPIALSYFAERRYIEEFKWVNTFPVFNDPVESIHALRIPRDYWRSKDRFHEI